LAVKIKTKRVAGRRRPAVRPARRTLAGRSSDFIRIHFWSILGLLMMAVLVHDLFGARGFLAMRRQQQEKVRLEQELERTQTENHDLSDSIQRLKTDPVYIERLAREQMGLARPGEHVFKIPAPQPADPAVESAKQ